MFASPPGGVESVGGREEGAAGPSRSRSGGASRRNPRRRVLYWQTLISMGGFWQTYPSTDGVVLLPARSVRAILCARAHTRAALCSKGVTDPMANPFIHVELSTQDP